MAKYADIVRMAELTLASAAEDFVEAKANLEELRAWDSSTLPSDVTRIHKIAMKFAKDEGGDGSWKPRSWMLGQEQVLRATSMYYPGAVYFQKQHVAQRCFDYLKKVGLI